MKIYSIGIHAIYIVLLVSFYLTKISWENLWDGKGFAELISIILFTSSPLLFNFIIVLLSKTIVSNLILMITGVLYIFLSVIIQASLFSSNNSTAAIGLLWIPLLGGFIILIGWIIVIFLSTRIWLTRR